MNVTPDDLLCVCKRQAEKKLKVQLTTVEQQHSKTQEVLKERENQLEKLRAQLKTAQGSFEEEMKKLKGQVAELHDVNVKKASSVLRHKHRHAYSCQLSHHIGALPVL